MLALLPFERLNEEEREQQERQYACNQEETAQLEAQAEAPPEQLGGKDEEERQRETADRQAAPEEVAAEAGPLFVRDRQREHGITPDFAVQTDEGVEAVARRGQLVARQDERLALQ